jgi:hypothetical protein
VLLLVAALAAPTGTATGQQSSVQLDSARAQIHRTLRRFYFSLAHQDWEALTADILAAKVVAHRPPPKALMSAADREEASSLATDRRVGCSSGEPALIGEMTIVLEGEWAQVSATRCTAALSGRDQFRLIHFEDRWRFVYIDLFDDPLNVSAGR